MSETILEINEIDNDWAGYKIVTNEQVITLLIDNRSNCCERWGYFFSEDDISEFIGAELLGIELTDAALNPASLEANELNLNERYFEGGVMFVNLNTSKGVLQFVAYNKHNGYYSHEAKVTSTQLTHEEYL